MPESSTQDSPSEEEITRFPLDWYQNFGLTAQSNAVRLARDKDGKLWGLVVTGFASNPASGTVRNYMPSAITDPTESATAGNSIARCFGSPFGTSVQDSTVGLVTNSRSMAMRAGSTSVWDGMRNGNSSRTVSAVATTNVLTWNTTATSNLRYSLDIYLTCSAGTATLTVEVSADGTNWITIDSLAAAATQIQHYDATVVGATTALSPIAFPYIRVTGGSAGAGNTTTMTVVFK